jgi:hypothetical protein
MEAAVIASERAASQAICRNVDAGFYTLVKSQISQKAVAAYAEMSSEQLSLLQMAKALDNIQQQMESDFHMIARRYNKLFQSLNKALEMRVTELDRPAMQLAEIRKNIVFDKLKDSSAINFSVTSEALPIAQMAITSKMKQNTRDTMQSLAGYIDAGHVYTESVKGMLASQPQAEPCASHIAAVLLETDSLLTANEQIDSVITAQAEAWQATAPLVSALSQAKSSLDWQANSEEDKAATRSEFMALCEKEVAGDERIAKEIARLFDASAWEAIK